VVCETEINRLLSADENHPNLDRLNTRLARLQARSCAQPAGMRVGDDQLHAVQTAA